MKRTLLSVAIGAVLAVAGLTVAGQAQAQPTDSVPVLVGHAGSPLKVAGNSIAGIRQAAADGATIVEMDVRWAKNDPGPAAFLSHDDSIAKTTNCNLSIKANWFGTLRACLLKGTKEPLPYVYDFLAAARKANVYVLLDMKAQPTKTQMANFLSYADRAEINWRSHIIWMANTPDQLKQARGWFPDLRYWLLQNETADSIRSCDNLRYLGAEVYAVPNYRIDPAKVQYWHGCVQVATWTTNTTAYDVPAEWERVREAGVDYLITNRVDTASPVLFPQVAVR